MSLPLLSVVLLVLAVPVLRTVTPAAAAAATVTIDSAQPRQIIRGLGGNFAAAMTAWRSTTENDGEQCFLRLVNCSDWLGALVGNKGVNDLWGI